MWDNEDQKRWEELTRKEEDGLLTDIEKIELNALESQAEWEMYQDLMYMR